MATNKVSSIEEQIDFNSVKIPYLTKTEAMDPEIDDALKIEESKKGGKGGNYPDIKLFIDLESTKVPVMIECKGTKGDLCKLDENGVPANKSKDGSNNLKNISKYAVNGAIHYANAIIEHSKSYKEVVAVGLNV